MAAFIEQPARVECAACGQSVDTLAAEPLSTIPCPRCRADVFVPGLLGSLRLIRALGEGTSGIVYLAHDVDLNREVAVKVFFKGPSAGPAETGSDPTGDVKTQDKTRDAHVEKALAEARALNALEHPNVVRIYKVEQKNGRPYIVMEYLAGNRLDTVIDEKWLVEEPRALRMAIDIAQGLKAVNDAGYAHLDVKPANIQMDAAGTCKLLDYETARELDHIEEHGAGLVGTPYYVAPEIVLRLPVDFRADIFSLGATLFHLIAQRPPFQGENSREVVQERLKRRAMNLREIRPDISPQTAAIIDRMLAPDAVARYGSYESLLDELNQAFTLAMSRQSAKAQQTQARPAKLAPTTWAAIVAGGLVAVVVLIAMAMRPDEPTTPTQRAVDANLRDSQRDGGNTNSNKDSTRPDSAKDKIAVNPPVKDGAAANKDAAAKDSSANKDGPAIKDGKDHAAPKDNSKDGAQKDGDKNVDPVKPPATDPTKTPATDPTKSPATDPTKTTDPIKPPPPANFGKADEWKPSTDVRLTTDDGRLTVWSTGSKPYIQVAGVPGPGYGNDTAVVEIRVRSSGEGPARIAWNTDKADNWDHQRAKSFDLRHDNEWRDHIISLPAKGAALELRIELGAGPGIAEIAWIKYFHKADNTAPTRQWRFDVK